MGRKKQSMIEDNSIENLTGKTGLKEVIDALDVTPVTVEIDYSPLTKDDYDWLVEVLPQNKIYLQAKHSHRLWDLKNLVDGTNEGRICTCKSSGGKWKRALNVLNDYVISKNA